MEGDSRGTARARYGGSYTARVRRIGDRIASLTREESAELGEYLRVEYENFPFVAAIFAKLDLTLMQEPGLARLGVALRSGGDHFRRGRVYTVLEDAESAADGLVRIADESGQERLCPEEYFDVFELPRDEAARILAKNRD